MASRRSHLIVLAVIFAALVGVGLLAAPGSPLERKPVLGLDLQGGLEVVLQAVPPQGRQLQESDLRRSETIIRNRIDKLGVAEPEVRRQGEDQISVQLAGVRDAERARELIGKTAQLEFYDLEGDLVAPSISQDGFPVPSERLYDLLAGIQRQVEQEGAGAWYLFRGPDGDEGGDPSGQGDDPTGGSGEERRLVAGPVADRAALEGTEAFEELGDNGRILGVPENRIVLHCGAGGAVVCPGVQELRPQNLYFYLFRHQPDDEEDPVPEMTGNDLRLSGTRQDFDPSTSEPIVLMQFTDEGREKFARITRELAHRGKFQSAGANEDRFQHFAIVLDNEIRSWPSIDFNENPNGIAGSTGAQITGMAGLNEAQDLAIVLQTGALPVEFRTLSETEISATLGEDSLQEAWRAAIAGLLVVALFLLVFYRFLGLVAVIGLAIYAALLYAVILIFNVTLTLPSFAGMILTIGVAADANIVVFERIKEESRAGKSVRAAIASGYSKGLSTIIDANVVTALTALVLFSLATAGVKGFALMLLIGTAMSIVTAVLATRAMLGLLAGFRWFDSPAFMGAKPREIPPWQRIDIIGRRRLWFVVASVLIAFSIGSLVFKGLNLGIDFQGGTQIAFTTTQPVAVEDVRAEAARIGQEKAVIQGVGEESGGGYREFQVRTETLDDAETRQLTRGFEEEFGAVSRGARTVSASFSEDILRGALWAVALSFLLITIYVSIRFQWRFSVPILRTIVNDGLIALGFYSISGREVSAATVAAFLTIIGYSIYDTIIVFDRVRENLRIMRTATIKQIVNVSLWETIPRSLATTFSTLLPVAVLFIFGGETLKDFAFAVLVGIGLTAFSTILIAAPFLAVLLERHPEYRRRQPSTDGGGVGKLLGRREQVTASAPAVEPAPEPAAAAADRRAGGDGASKRERRRQRRRSRPHCRAR